MKKLLMTVAALAAVVVLNSCGKTPTIELPKDDATPVFDL
jgi:predicted small lipoprotein YifL